MIVAQPSKLLALILCHWNRLMRLLECKVFLKLYTLAYKCLFLMWDKDLIAIGLKSLTITNKQTLHAERIELDPLLY